MTLDFLPIHFHSESTQSKDDYHHTQSATDYTFAKMTFRQRLRAMRQVCILSDEFDQPVSRFLHPSVLRFVFVVFVAASTGTFAASWRAAPDGNNYDSGFFNLLSQSFLTLLAAPIAYAQLVDRKSAENIGNTMNFVSAFFAVVTANQLARGVMCITD